MNDIEYWYKKNWNDVQLKKLKLCDVVKEAGIYFPDIKQAFVIAIAQPRTTCSIERSSPQTFNMCPKSFLKDSHFPIVPSEKFQTIFLLATLAFLYYFL